jgi:hypothetical protein
VSSSDASMQLRRITILERNADYHDAAEQCFLVYERIQDPNLALRGFQNLINSVWRSNTLSEMRTGLSELLSRIRKAKETMRLKKNQVTYLEAVALEAEGWLAEPPNPKKFIQATELFLQLSELEHALNLITSLIAYIDPSEQIHWAQHGIEIATKLSPEKRDTYYILLIEPLLLYEEGEAKEALLKEIIIRIKALSKIEKRKDLANIAVLTGLDLVHPFRIEEDEMQNIRQDNVHELVRALSEATHNRIRGMLLSLLGTSNYRMAEAEESADIRQELFKKAKDYFLQSVAMLERTPAYGELLRAYTLAGEGFLSIAELEPDFARRNEFYQLGEMHLQKSRSLGNFTQLLQLRARVAINLGVALERLSWFELSLERRKKKLLEIYKLQLEGQDFAEQTNGLQEAAYATMYASEVSGFLSDLESRGNKKHEWALKQQKFSRKSLALFQKTLDKRGLVAALSSAAFACLKLADLTPTFEEKKALFEDMFLYGELAIEGALKIIDPVIIANAYQQAGNAAQRLGVLCGDNELLKKAIELFDCSVQEWSKTGERHKHANALTQLADTFLYFSSLDFTVEETTRQHYLTQSQRLHLKAANIYSNLFFFHDEGENYWRIGQIHLLKEDYHGAQQYFDKVQKAFAKVAELIPSLAEIYSVFSTFGTTFVGLVDGLRIIKRGNYSHATKLFNELALDLNHETDRSLRQLRQLLIALSSIAKFAATKESKENKKARAELERMAVKLPPDAFEQQLPYSLHKTIHRLQIFLIAPKLFFPPLLLDLPLKEKMIVMTQTRHLVRMALNMYKATADQRETIVETPTEDTIRNYVARISNIIAER